MSNVYFARMLIVERADKRRFFPSFEKKKLKKSSSMTRKLPLIFVAHAVYTRVQLGDFYLANLRATSTTTSSAEVVITIDVGERANKREKKKKSRKFSQPANYFDIHMYWRCDALMTRVICLPQKKEEEVASQRVSE